MVMNVFAQYQSNQKRQVKNWTAEKANIKEAGKGRHILNGRRKKKAKFSHQIKGEDKLIREINGYKTVISIIKYF